MSTQETIRRARLAIAECARFIDKEEKRRDDIRPADMHNHLDFCKRRKMEMEELLTELMAA